MPTVLKLSSRAGHQVVLSPGQAGLRWLGLELLRLSEGRDWRGELGSEEGVLVLLAGKATVSVQGERTETYASIGGRSDMFAGPPASVYAPRASKLAVEARTDCEVALVKAACETTLPPAYIAPEAVRVVSSGAANWRRDIRMILPPGSPLSERLIVGETVNPPGNWSGIPPHRHERVVSGENLLEEFYLFRARPTDGFGVQLFYGGSDADARIVTNDDVTVMLGGYHPTVAAPGVTLCYLWALAGENKAYEVAIDARFAWVPIAESVIREAACR